MRRPDQGCETSNADRSPGYRADCRRRPADPFQCGIDGDASYNRRRPSPVVAVDGICTVALVRQFIAAQQVFTAFHFDHFILMI